MKKSLFFAALLLGLGISCNKSNSGSTSYHVTATIDGKNETFNVSPAATRTYIGGATYIAVSGLATSSPTGGMLELGLSNNPGGPAIKAGTYSDTSSVFTLNGIYQVSTSEQYAAGSIVVFGTTGGVNPPITNHFKLVITSIDSTSIKGTFSGDYYAGGSTAGAKKTITNGDFYAKIF